MLLSQHFTHFQITAVEGSITFSIFSEGSWSTGYVEWYDQVSGLLIPSGAEINMFIFRSRVNGVPPKHTLLQRCLKMNSSRIRMEPRTKKSWDAGKSRTNSGKQWREFLGGGKSVMWGDQSVWVRNEGASILGGRFLDKVEMNKTPKWDGEF